MQFIIQVHTLLVLFVLLHRFHLCRIIFQGHAFNNHSKNPFLISYFISITIRPNIYSKMMSFIIFPNSLFIIKKLKICHHFNMSKLLKSFSDHYSKIPNKKKYVINITICVTINTFALFFKVLRNLTL